MKTVFSLLHTSLTERSGDPLQNVVGPLLFQSSNAARDALLSSLRTHLSRFHPELVAIQSEALGVDLSNYSDDDGEQLRDSEALYLLSSEESTITLDALCDWVNKARSGTPFSFRIQEVPVSSFIEMAMDADAIEIDGNFIRNFSLASPDELALDHSAFLDASMVDDDFVRLEFSISLGDAQNATYCSSSKSWNVGKLSVAFFQLR